LISLKIFDAPKVGFSFSDFFSAPENHVQIDKSEQVFFIFMDFDRKPKMHNPVLLLIISDL
jgi:hypothetical protein